MASILVADNDPGSMQRTVDSLESADHTIRLATNVWDTIQQIEDEQPELVVLETALADDESFDLAGWLIWECKVPVVIYTERPTDARHVSVWAADAHLLKSRDHAMLEKTVDWVLQVTGGHVTRPQRRQAKPVGSTSRSPQGGPDKDSRARSGVPVGTAR